MRTPSAAGRSAQQQQRRTKSPEFDANSTENSFDDFDMLDLPIHDGPSRRPKNNTACCSPLLGMGFVYFVVLSVCSRFVFV